MSVPDPALHDWVPMFAAGPVPAVVDGKWLKGVGGAAVWSQINPADVTDNSVSSFLRTVPGSQEAHTAKIQTGQTYITVPAGDPASVTITLPTPWPNAHVAFFGSAWPGAHWNINAKAIGLANGLSQGVHAIYNATSQPMTIYWISFGW